MKYISLKHHTKIEDKNKLKKVLNQEQIDMSINQFVDKYLKCPNCGYLEL